MVSATNVPYRAAASLSNGNARGVRTRNHAERWAATPAGIAAYHGHPDLAALLKGRA